MNKLENKNRQNRVPLSPQTEKENQRQVHLNADFLFWFAPPRRRRREMSEHQRTKSRREGGEPHRLPRNLSGESGYFPDKLLKINKLYYTEKG